MSHVGKLRKKLFGIIDAVCSQREKYFASSGKDFTRKGKFMPQDIFKSILLMENKSLSHELLPYFEYKKDTPTPSAFVQARAKIKPEGFEAVFNDFVSETTDKNEKYLHKGYRIFAVDGSDSHVPDNPDDPDAYFPNPNGRPYSLFHIDAMYDLLWHTYTDVVIKKKRTENERAAFIPKDYDCKAPAQFYELPVRIVRFKVINTTEVIMTNLSQEEFSAFHNPCRYAGNS